MLAAEWIWLARWLGDSPTSLLGGEDLAEMNALRERWKQVEDQRREFIAGLRDEDLLGEVRYRNTKGEPFAYPLGPLMQHVVNHATLHRGQVVAMIRQMGATPPATDLLYYFAKPR